MSKIDELDRKIIAILERDARLSSTKVAAMLNTSPTTVRRRIEQLAREGTISIVAVADANKLGFLTFAAAGLNVAPGKLDSVVEKLSGYPETRWVIAVTGRFDVIFVARFRSNDEMYQFVKKKLATIDCVNNYELFIGLHSHKVLLTKV